MASVRYEEQAWHLTGSKGSLNGGKRGKDREGYTMRGGGGGREEARSARHSHRPARTESPDSNTHPSALEGEERGLALRAADSRESFSKEFTLGGGPPPAGEEGFGGIPEPVPTSPPPHDLPTPAQASRLAQLLTSASSRQFV